MSTEGLIEFLDKYEKILEEKMEEEKLKLVIDHVECNFFLCVEKDVKKKYWFSIDCRYLDYCLYEEEKFENKIDLVNKINDVINHYKFSKFVNKFVSKEEYDCNVALLSSFEKMNKDSVQDYHCPICFENEGTMTLKCCHKICYHCRIKMIKCNKSEEDPKCPICKDCSLFDTYHDLNMYGLQIDLTNDLDDESSDDESDDED